MYQPSANDPPTRQLLHIGCGSATSGRLPSPFRAPCWREIRYDIDPAVQPDIVGTMTQIGRIDSESIDAIWSSHNLEHLHSFEVPLALAEFRRVLKPTGFALISLPDMRAIARHIASDGLLQPLYDSGAGTIRAIDVVYGHQASIEQGNHYMAHRTGFTARTLGDALVAAGFSEVRVHEGRRWDLWALAAMPDTTQDIYNEFGDVML